MPGDLFNELHGFWHFWHLIIFSSIRLTDERPRRLAMSGSFGNGPQFPERFFRVLVVAQVNVILVPPSDDKPLKRLESDLRVPDTGLKPRC
jgi:hypothetical protein